MNLEFDNNQSWIWTVNLAAWAPVYPLANCVFHMQIRTAPGIPTVVYAWSSNPSDGWGNGTITFVPSTNLLTSNAPQSDMLKIPQATYDWDLLLIYNPLPTVPGMYKVLTGGQLVIDQGITTS